MRLFFLLILVFPFYVNSQIDYDKYFTSESLRIDFVRNSGENNKQFENLVFKKELYWSGNPNKTIEHFDYGEYRVELRDSVSNELLFTYSYSSLFHEYLFTEESAIRSKSFEETVRMPFPKNTVELNFKFRNQNTNRWVSEKVFFFNPHTLEIERTTFDVVPEVRNIHSGGDYKNCLDVVFLAEGYTLEEIDKFFKDSERISKYLFKCKPYSQYINHINIWAVFEASEESGINDPIRKIHRNSALGLTFSTFDSDRYLMTESIFKLRDLASAVPYDHIVIIANTKKYGGGGIYNFYATCPSDNFLSDYLLIHEFGHSFGGLADEYYTSDVSVVDFYNINLEPWEPNITSLVNFDLKWKDQISENIPIPTPSVKKYSKEVGVFEGGGYMSKGIYRPYYDCSMKSAVFNKFCPICLRSLEDMINYYVDIE